MKDSLLLGYISAAHGIKGWIKVFSYCEPRENIFSYKRWVLVDTRNKQHDVKISKGQVNGKTLIAKLGNCEDRNSAEAWIGSKIYIPESDLPVLDDTYYWRDLLGLRVLNQAGISLGVVSGFMETGANDVLEVTPDAGDAYSGKRLIPFILDQVVTKVAMDDGTIEVDWEADF